MTTETSKEHLSYSVAELADKHGKSIYRFCRKLTYSKVDADDLFQDTFLSALEKGIDTESRLLTTAIYLWKSKKRKFARRSRIAPIVQLDDSYAVIDPDDTEDRIIMGEMLKVTHELVDILPEKLRIPVLLYYSAEQSVADISAATNIPEGTVKSRLYKARKEIEKGLKKHGYEL